MASQHSESPSTAYSLSSSPIVQHAAAIGIAVIAVLARCYVSWRTHLTADDALNALRYADILAAGHRFVYHGGVHVLGIPGPLYVFLLSAFPPHISALLAAKACNIAADGVTCYLLARLLARDDMGRPVEGLFAAAIYALSTMSIIVSIGGTETGLVTCVGLAMVCAYAARRPYWLYTLGALLFLLRYDGLLLFAVLAAGLALRDRKLPLRAGAIFLIFTLPWLIFALAPFRSAVPTSLTPALAMTVSNSAGSAVREASNVNIRNLTLPFISGWIQCGMIMLFGLGAIIVVFQAIRRSERGVMAAPLIWCLAYIGMVLCSIIPLSPASLLPMWPIFIAIACLAGATAPVKLGKMRPDLASTWSGRAVPGALALLILIGILHIRSVVVEIGRSYSPQGRISGSSLPAPGSEYR